MASARTAVLAVALVATSVAAAVATGCAGPGVQIMSTAEGNRHDPIQRGYDVGFDRGRSDAARGAKPDPKMPGREKDAETIQSYAQGYEDGYAGRSNRFGSVDSRDWMHRDKPSADDSGGAQISE